MLQRHHLWDKFTDVIQSINQMLTDYAQGDFTTLGQTITNDYYNSISVTLLELKLDPVDHPEYELIRNTISRSFQGLYQSMLLYARYMEDQNQIAALTTKANILDDMAKLKDYILELQRHGRMGDIFPHQTIQAGVKAILKPEYAEYIRLYGFPENAVFDTDRLAEILLRLGIAVENIGSDSDSVSSISSNCSSRAELIQVVMAMDSDVSGVPFYETGMEIMTEDVGKAVV
jgi:hypothetical protein